MFYELQEETQAYVNTTGHPYIEFNPVSDYGLTLWPQINNVSIFSDDPVTGQLHTLESSYM